MAIRRITSSVDYLKGSVCMCGYWKESVDVFCKVCYIALKSRRDLKQIVSYLSQYSERSIPGGPSQDWRDKFYNMITHLLSLYIHTNQAERVLLQISLNEWMPDFIYSSALEKVTIAKAVGSHLHVKPE